MALPVILVVAAVIEREGKILVGQRRRTDRHPLKWEFPGGKVEPNEETQAALARELQEELAIDAQIGPEIARYRYQYSGRSPIELIFYSVTAYSGQIRNLCFEQVRWLSRAELPGLDFLEGDIDFVRRLSENQRDPNP